MSDFEEMAFLSGFDDNENYLNHLCKNENEFSFYLNEDDEEEESLLYDDFPPNERNLDGIANTIIDDFYFKYENLNQRIFTYTFNFHDDVIFISENKYELIDLLKALDFNMKIYFFNFEIETSIDAYYASAKITGELMDAEFRKAMRDIGTF